MNHCAHVTTFYAMRYMADVDKSISINEAITLIGTEVWLQARRYNMLCRPIEGPIIFCDATNDEEKRQRCIATLLDRKAWRTDQ